MKIKNLPSCCGVFTVNQNTVTSIPDSALGSKVSAAANRR